MKIIDKQIQPSCKEALLSLKVKVQCLQDNASKKAYIRGEIRKIQKDNKGMKFRTKVINDTINVWRLS